MPTPYGGPMPPNPYGQPQMPDWLTQPAPLPVPNSPVQTPDMSQVKRRGMFGNADWGSAIAAALNGYLAAGGNPAGQLGLQQLHQKKMLEQEEAIRAQEYQQHRADGLQDYETQQMLQQKYAAPPQPGEFERALMESGVQPGTPAWTQAMKRRADNMLDPVVMTANGPMLRSQVVGTLSAGQPAPEGVTFTPIDDGGPTPPASGGFSY